MIGFAALLFVGVQAPTTEDIIDRLRHPEPQVSIPAEVAMLGVYQGLLYANAYLSTDESPRPIYCPPGNFNPTAKDLAALIEADGVKYGRPADDARNLAADTLFALIHAFPCRA